MTKSIAASLGKFGKGQKNSNGQLLLNFCAQQDLCLTNTFFRQPDKDFFTWKHPRSKQWHLLDYVITRKSGLQEITCTKAMRGPECSTDHRLVRCKVKLRVTLPRRKTTARPKPKKLDTAKLKSETHSREMVEAIAAALENATAILEESANIEERWDALKKSV